MFKELVSKVLKATGGKSNIIEATHCMTRLRLTIAKDSQVDQAALENISGVLGVVKKGNQYQIVIGPNVANVYKEFIEYSGLNETNDQIKEVTDSNEKVFIKVINTIAGIFNAIVPALAGAGLIKAILALLGATNVLSREGNTFMVLNTISDGVFVFLPILLAISSAKIFKMNTYVAVAIAAAMLHPTFTSLINEGVNQISFLNIPLHIISYTGTVLPIVFTIWLASYVEKSLDKLTPNALKIIMVPAFTILITTPISLLAVGPVTQFLGNTVADSISLLFEKGGIFAGLIYGGIFSSLVVTGLQHGMVPVLIDGISRYGYNRISPVSGSANMAQAGASFGVWLKAKDKNTKAVAATATISALTGVTEPAIYGVNLRLKRPFLCAALGGAAGGAVATAFGARSYAMGSPSFLTLPMFIGDPGNVWYVAIAFSVAFIVSAVATFLIGFDENPNTKITTK